jgi:serine/threonine protein kinase
MEPRRRFRIVKELAEGAFGKVFLAEMITGDNFKSVVAIKLLHGKWVGHEEIVQRSRDEARVLGLLHHRNIVRVEDLTSINGQCAIIMEYLEGVDLKSLIRYCSENNADLPRKVAFEIIASSATALDAAYHRKTLSSGQALRLIHRDIKPSNIMVTVSGEVKVLDFGTAQAQFEHREAETQALAFGSAAYMSPERMMGDQDTPAGDIFSLGITLYELLSKKGFGKVYIRGEKFDESLNERIDGLELSDLGQARATQVRQVMRLMLAYEVAERPSAQQVVELMEALAEEVNDGSLRRFCREVVGPAHQSVEASNPNGAFTGSTLFEDSSRVRIEELEDVEARVIAEVPESTDQSTSVLPVQAGLEYLSDPLAPEIEETDVAEGGYAAYVESGASSASVSSASNGEPEASAGGGRGLILLAVFGLTVGIAVLYAGFNKFVNPAPDPVSDVVVDAPKYITGGTVETKQAGGSGGALSLEISGDEGAKVTVSAALSGFNYKWDGTGVLKLNDLQEGPYRVRIKTDGASFVLQTKVETGRTCAYRYDLEGGGEDWDKSGC